MIRSVLPFCVALLLAGCKAQCGSQYRGSLELEELCGAVYGSQGRLTGADDEIVQLSFEFSTRPGRPYSEIEHEGFWVEFSTDELERGADLTEEDVTSACVCSTGGSYAEPMESLDLHIGGRMLMDRYDADGQSWKFEWDWTCPCAEASSNGTDFIKLRTDFAPWPVQEALESQ